MSLLPRQIITPVVGVEESKRKGESYPGDDVNFLSLEVEISVPLDQRVGLAGRWGTVDHRAWRWWRVVGTVTTLNNKAQLQVSVLHYHWSTSNEARLSLVESFRVMPVPAFLCHKEPAWASV